jgi:hypothetical protein
MVKKLLLFNILFSLAGILSAQCVLTAKCAGGDWTAPSTWNNPGCGGVTAPANSCNIIIPACATVHVDLNSPTYTSMNIYVYGTLFFDNGQKINLSANGNVYVFAGGKLDGGNGGSKINIGGSTVWNGPGPDPGPFSFGPAPLPIELLLFSVVQKGNKGVIAWSTATETNNDYYTLERSSDGTSFESVIQIDGAGNSSSVLNYSAEDKDPYEGISYYRLKQTDFNGRSSYSHLAMLEFHHDAEFSFNLYPNPNDGSAFNISIDSKKDDEVLVVVYDALGKETYSKVIITGSNNDDVYAMDPSGKLNSGIYLITATSQQSIQSKRMIVK